MTTVLNKALYTAEATVKGGRDGHGRSADGVLDLDIRPPVEMGGPGGGTNPEQLFAARLLRLLPERHGRGRHAGWGSTPSDSEVTGRVTIGTIDGGAFGIAVELDVHIPGVDEATAQQVVDAAHEVCPYSNATRGNIEVTLKVV